MISIYDDQETKDLIKSIKNNDPNFNFSAFFKESLMCFYSNDIGLINKNFLNKRINQLKEEKDKINNELERYSDLFNRVKIKDDEDKFKQKQSKEEEKRREEEKIKEISKNMLFFYEIPKKEINNLISQFIKTKNNNLFQFLSLKGYKEKK